MKKLIILLLLLTLPMSTYAATYYVEAKATASSNEADDGATAWAAATSISTPVSAGTAMARAVADDIVYFRGGTYDLNHTGTLSYDGVLNPSNSGTSGHPITFMAYPDETPILDADTTVSGWDNGVSLGLNCQDYITYDGFHLIADGGASMGALKMQGNDCPDLTGIVVKNMDFYGGTTVVTSGDNRSLLRIENSADITVQGCTFHDLNSATDELNTTAITMYSVDGIVIENNEFDTISTAIYIKQDINNITVRNNYLHDNYLPIRQENASASSGTIVINNNVFANNTRHSYNTLTSGAYTGDDVDIYNNTFYDGVVGVDFGTNTTGHGADVYNNIFYSTDKAINTSGDSSTLKTSDHNIFYPSLNIRMYESGSNQTDYTSLTTWQSSGALEGGANPGVGSLVTNPNFTNGSGSLNTLADFEVSNTSGRSSGLIGADVSTVGTGSVSTSTGGSQLGGSSHFNNIGSGGSTISF